MKAPRRNLLKPINLCCENEIALGQTVNFVRPNLDLHFSPGQINIRMMPLRFGEFADFVREIKRLSKVWQSLRR